MTVLIEEKALKRCSLDSGWVIVNVESFRQLVTSSICTNLFSARDS